MVAPAPSIVKPVRSKLFPAGAPFTVSVSPAKVFNPPKSAKGLTKPALGTFTMNVSLPGPP